MYLFSKFRKCNCRFLKHNKLGLSKVVKLKIVFFCNSLSRRPVLNSFSFLTLIFLKVSKGHYPLEEAGVEVGLQNILSGHTLVSRPIPERFIFIT